MPKPSPALAVVTALVIAAVTYAVASTAPFIVAFVAAVLYLQNIDRGTS